MKHRYKKHYTREEANALLPDIRRWLQKLGQSYQAMGKLEKRLSGMVSQGGDVGGEQVNQYVKTLVDIKEVLDEFQVREIFIKDATRGLIDFPAIIGGKEVFLCWEQDEETVEFWHDLETGFAGRERL